jgi:dual specificity tyrosine-phosphorylation-regulated kinase 1
MHRNHQCLVFESLSLNLFELLKSTQFCGLPLSRTRKIAKQVLQALSFLARKDVDVLHCDLKPENIVLKDPNKSDVKVIDFGASRMSNIDMYSYIQSRSYRAPEVMLGLPYNVAIDMWSLGCILVELHNGRALFPSFHELDLMQKIVGTLGMMPHEMLERVKDHRRQQFFKAKRSSSGESIWKLKKAIVLLTQDSTPKLVRQKASADPIASLNKIVQLGAINQKVCPVESAENYAQFVDLVYKMLAIEPNARITPHEALHHPFIAERRYRQTDIRTFLRPLKRIRIEENEE